MFLLSSLMIITSCSKEDLFRKTGAVAATAEITVLLDGKREPNVTVYMFNKPSSDTFGKDPIYAKKSVVTNKDGVAHFELQETYDLENINTQTTLYFTVFYNIGNKNYLSSVGVTLKKGDNIKETLRVSSFR